MVLMIGEILYYTYFNKRKIGGNAFHFLYHLASLQVPVNFISRIGTDTEGKQILNMLEYSNIPTHGIQVDASRSTPIIKLENNFNDHTIHDEATLQEELSIDNIDQDNYIESLLQKEIKLFYFNALIQRSETNFNLINNILAKINRNKTHIICDLNFHFNHWNVSTIIHNSLRYSDIIKINYDKLPNLKHIIGYEDSTDDFLYHIINDYKIKWILIYSQDGSIQLYSANNHYTVNYMTQPAPGAIANNFGIGDAFFTMLGISLIENWSIEKTIEIANEFTQGISDIKGAIPYTDDFYSTFKEEINISM